MSKSKWSCYYKEIIELINNDSSLSDIGIAKKVLKTEGSHKKNPEINSLRKYVARHRKKNAISKEDFENDIDSTETTTETNQYSSKQVFSAISKNGGIMDINTYCEYYGLDRNQVRSFKLVTHTGTPYYNIAFYESIEEKVQEIDFISVFKTFVKPVIPATIIVKKEYSAIFDRLVYTDAHIGLDPNSNGYSLYGGKWNEEEIKDRLDIIVEAIIKEQNSKKLFIDDLGDFMDGWDGETTRKGHKLSQNMDNQTAYDVGVSFKIELIDRIIGYYDEIVCHNICNDNHGGAFAYVVNSGFKNFIELKYKDKVKVVNQRKFMDHYMYSSKHCFVLSHGKDEKEMKFGLSPKLNDKTENFINSYIDEHFLHQEGIIIEFSKGDSHQQLFDDTSANKFNYYSYKALSPSSSYVQNNFKKGISGFTFFNYYEDRKSVHPYDFDWEK